MMSASERCKRWRKRNRERYLALDRQWRIKNRAKYLKRKRQRYIEHRDELLVYAEKYRQRQREIIQKKAQLRRNRLHKLKDVPCTDCKRRYPQCVMEFDHKQPPKQYGGKRSCMGALAGCSEKTLLEEVAKCDLVCANCHRIRTHNRRIAKREIGPETATKIVAALNGDSNA